MVKAFVLFTGMSPATEGFTLAASYVLLDDEDNELAGGVRLITVPVHDGDSYSVIHSNAAAAVRAEFSDGDVTVKFVDAEGRF